MTDYRNSTPTGETPWGITTYDYTPRSEVHVRPPSTVTERTSHDNSVYRGPAVADQPLAMIRIEGNRVHFVGRNVQSTVARYGRRTLVSVHEILRSDGRIRLRVLFDCDCGARDHTALDDWRKAIASGFIGQCKTCAWASKRGAGAMPSKAARVAKQKAELERLPYRDRVAK